MRILVIGSGGREHALCWAIAASPLTKVLWCAPGNAGIAKIARCVPIAAENLSALVDFATAEQVDLVVVGPETPLCEGLVDRLNAAGIRAFGPTAAAARIEGSKGFMKDLAARAGVPTARYRRFNDSSTAKAYILHETLPIVIKVDGLAAGKGVVIAETMDAAMDAMDAALVRREFGLAGGEVVIEEFMEGEEASFFALCDGETAIPLAAAQDHKRVFDGDKGPNTGGMGAYSPASVMTQEVIQTVMSRIIGPTLAEMKKLGFPFKGILYAGLMITPKGPKLIEYNARFGDPECQVLLPRLKSDLVPLLVAACDGKLAGRELEWRNDTSLCVVMAAQGYPGKYNKGTAIGNLDAAAEIPGVTIFHAGTQQEGNRLLSNGGRVLNIVALGQDVAEAQRRAYQAVDLIDWPEGFCRRDIGWRAIKSVKI